MWTVSVSGRIGIVDRETVYSIEYRVYSEERKRKEIQEKNSG
ncbi:hypothetical protein ES703_05882 [subsurface metagenome]